jgi:hypothetical protein
MMASPTPASVPPTLTLPPRPTPPQALMPHSTPPASAGPVPVASTQSPSSKQTFQPSPGQDTFRSATYSPKQPRNTPVSRKATQPQTTPPKPIPKNRVLTFLTSPWGIGLGLAGLLFGGLHWHNFRHNPHRILDKETPHLCQTNLSKADLEEKLSQFRDQVYHATREKMSPAQWKRLSGHIHRVVETHGNTEAVQNAVLTGLFAYPKASYTEPFDHLAPKAQQQVHSLMQGFVARKSRAKGASQAAEQIDIDILDQAISVLLESPFAAQKSAEGLKQELEQLKLACLHMHQLPGYKWDAEKALSRFAGLLPHTEHFSLPKQADTSEESAFDLEGMLHRKLSEGNGVPLIKEPETAYSTPLVASETLLKLRATASDQNVQTTLSQRAAAREAYNDMVKALQTNGLLYDERFKGVKAPFKQLIPLPVE